VLIYSGAKFLCPCAGTISLMPGTSSNPAFRRIDVDPRPARCDPGQTHPVECVCPAGRGGLRVDLFDLVGRPADIDHVSFV
jgi:hypothetical protein